MPSFDVIIPLQGNPGTAGQPGTPGLPGERGDRGDRGDAGDDGEPGTTVSSMKNSFGRRDPTRTLMMINSSHRGPLEHQESLVIKAQMDLR